MYYTHRTASVDERSLHGSKHQNEKGSALEAFAKIAAKNRKQMAIDSESVNRINF